MVISVAVTAQAKKYKKTVQTHTPQEANAPSTINTLYPGVLSPQITNLSQQLAHLLNQSFANNSGQETVRYLGEKQLGNAIFPASQASIPFVLLDIALNKNKITQTENAFFQGQFAQNVYAGITQYLAGQQ